MYADTVMGGTRKHRARTFMTMIIWKAGEELAVVGVLLEADRLVRVRPLEACVVWDTFVLMFVCIAGSTSKTGNAYYDAARDSRRAAGAH